MKRSPIARKTPLRRHKAEGPSIAREPKPMARAQAKPAKCKHCKKALGEERAIHFGCVDGWYAANREKLARAVARKAEREARAERAVDRAKRQAMKSVKTLKAETQEAFNDFIRARDADLPCVSCGEANPPMKPGGQWDAGHFLTRGAHPELAFDEDNCHKQCKSCNAGGGRFSAKARTVNAAYEEELLRRIGPERLDRLKGPHEVRPLDRDELIALKAHYRAKRRELEKGKS